MAEYPHHDVPDTMTPDGSQYEEGPLTISPVVGLIIGLVGALVLALLVVLSSGSLNVEPLARSLVH